MINFYKFKNIDNSYISNFWIDILNNEYQKYNFIAIEKHINEINKSFFLSPHTKKIINDTYYCNLKLKRLIEKIKAKYIKYKKNINPINNTYLNFENIEPNIDKTLNIDINTRKKNNFYRLHISEIIQLFKVSLLNHAEGFPNPYIPSNPYTGITFNLSEIIYIFTSLEYNSSLPIELILFKNCSFNIDKLLENHKNHFVLKASTSFINELDDIQWNNILKEWYKNNKIKKIACWKCLNEIPDLRNLIKNIIYLGTINIRYDRLNNIFIPYNITSHYLQSIIAIATKNKSISKIIFTLDLEIKSYNHTNALIINIPEQKIYIFEPWGTNIQYKSLQKHYNNLKLDCISKLFSFISSYQVIDLAHKYKISGPQFTEPVTKITDLTKLKPGMLIIHKKYKYKNLFINKIDNKYIYVYDYPQQNYILIRIKLKNDIYYPT